MKELGQYLKEHRVLNGISLEEAANDLKINESELENLEVGNTRAFKDIYVIKEYVKIYSKYLGLDYQETVKEFNDFLFEHTSKISLDDIMAEKKKRDVDEKKISSPYTKIKERKFSIAPMVFAVLIVLFLSIVIYLIITLPSMIEGKDNNIELKRINMEGKYELT